MSKKLVVIIDDEDPILEVLRLMVEKFGYKTECFYNVSDSLGFIQRRQIDLVILDYSIPGEDGMNNIMNLLNLKPRIKIILLSGLDMSKSKEFLDAGVSKCLQKPVKMETLKKQIKEVLDTET